MNHTQQMTPERAPEHSHTDPVCGMTVSSESDLKTVHEATTYYFCCRRCLTRFEANPHEFLAPKTTNAVEPAGGRHICPMCPGVEKDGPGICPKCGMALEPEMPAALATRIQYTCPMHPEVIQDNPGNCPICGMSLEPMTVTAEADANPELIDMTRRFWGSAALTIPLFVIAMGEMLPGWDPHWFGSPRVLAWLELGLATPVVLWGGWPFFVRAWQSLVTRHLNMFTLIGLGTGVAYGYSLVATLAPAAFPPAFQDAHGGVAVYFEAAAVIITLVLLGQVLELKARGRTGDAIQSLLALTPKMARLIADDGSESDVPIEQVRVGERLRIRPGENIPLDAVVVDGESVVDEAMITGEPIPVAKSPGAHVIGATINSTGSLIIEVERVGTDTLLAKIVQMVVSAQRSRAPIQKVADTVAGYFVPTVVVIALLTFVVWSFIGPAPAMAYATLNAVAVLIIACPCALGLATPMSIMTATGKGAAHGVLFRDAEAIEVMRKVDTLVVDKTGTLTNGRPELVGVHAEPAFSEEEVLRLAAGIEQASEHPLAAAIVRGAEQLALSIPAGIDFRSITGKGVTGSVDGHKVSLGDAKLMSTEGIDITPVEEQMEARRKEGETVMVLGVDGKLAGIVAVADAIKTSTAAAIDVLRAEGMQIVMLTGDHETTALAVGGKLGLDQVIAGVLPDEKAKAIARLQSEGRIVAMAGDGINDAPALAAADVGIAMGTGTDIAIESAGVTLVKGDLKGIWRARQLSRATMRNIHQNLFFAFVYNALGISIAAGILYPSFGLLLSPMIGAAAMSLSSVSVIMNALRLNRLSLQ